jgi:hypothetical protein
MWSRWCRWAAVVGLLAVTYVGSYAALYRRGVAEADAYGYRYFFYVPFADIESARGTTRQHQMLLSLYGPLNDLHHRRFGGRDACRSITFGSSPERPEGQACEGVKGYIQGK